MEKYVQLLYDRIKDDQDKAMKLIMIMDGAINEMHNNGIFSQLPLEVQEKVHSKDPEERITVKSSIAKSLAYNSFIVLSQPLRLKNGDISHMISVKFNPTFINSIALCIQGGLEGLYQNGSYKHCEDDIMQYYIQTDAQGEDYTAFRRKMMDLESLYDNFQINFIPVQSLEKKETASVSKSTEVKKEEKKEEKTGLFAKLFSKNKA